MARKFLLFTALMLIFSTQIVKASIVSTGELKKLYCLSGTLQDIVIGDTYIYNNALDYNDMQLRFTPYPWQDGRIRNGKYKSSPKAKDDYLKSLKALSGKKFKAVKTVSNVIIDEMIAPVDGVVMVDEKGDSIFYITGMGKMIMQFEFVNDACFLELQKLVGKHIVNITAIPAPPVETGQWPVPMIVDTKTKKNISIPKEVEWKITKISNTDTTYYGERESIVDQASNTSIKRVTVHISNATYGECFFYLNYLNDLFIIKE